MESRRAPYQRAFIYDILDKAVDFADSGTSEIPKFQNKRHAFSVGWHSQNVKFRQTGVVGPVGIYCCTQSSPRLM